MATRSESGGFGAFFRRYTKTWMHAVATAGLTAFGTLTIVHRGFVVLAIASYVVPPIVLYLSRTRGPEAPTATGGDESRSPTEAALADQTDFGTDSGASERVDPPAATPPDAASTDGRDPKPTADGEAIDRESGIEGVPETDDGGPEPDELGPETGEEELEVGGQKPGIGEQEDESEADLHWTPVDVPTDATLADVAIADGGAVAVGDGGAVLVAAGDDWDPALEDGPGAQGQDLRAVDATADGDVAWVAGDGGAVGRVEITTGRHADHSAPADRTDNLTGLAVAGATGDETILLANGSGEVIRGRYRDGDLAWDGPKTPGSGSSLSGVDLLDDAIGYCCDTNDGVFRTDDGGQTYDAIGVDGTDGTLTDVAAGEGGACHVSTDAGVVHRYDGSTWTPDRITDGALSALARHGDRLVATDDEGAVYDRADPTADWERVFTGASGPLHGVAIGPDRSIAVGAEGTVVERR
ncbi:WD40/YVTN/BNR-like repeat-containing protein [Halosolutus halophilus]|uniref:WD40/YVTN/BNR-like repeat-containing protein n=1 Tax=Halosolutus halophilus TaxID=1552990 RepID=UPI0022352E51|nr:hypothetical protein [Halosolutus halophilus]